MAVLGIPLKKYVFLDTKSNNFPTYMCLFQADQTFQLQG